jgi:lysophospholipase L1-like esterase
VGALVGAPATAVSLWIGLSIRGLLLATGGFAVLTGAFGCGNPASPTPPTDPFPNGPTITCPATPPPITASNSLGASVQFGTPTSIGGAPAVAISCAPASGTLFPIGTTKVTCTAVDARQRTDTCSFNVVVQTIPVISMTQFVAFGDSITWGEDGNPEVLCGSNNNLSPQSLDLIRPRQQVALSNQYPMALQLKLAARYATQAAVISVDNAGNPGEPAGAPSTLTRLQQVLGSKRYDAILLMEGTNDIFYGDPAQVDVAINGNPPGSSGLSAMVTVAKSRGLRVFLATVPPMVPGGSRACGHLLVAPLDDRIRALAASQGVTLVDVYAGMGSTYAQYIGPDGLHPNVAGYDKIADIFFNVLKSTLEVSPTTMSTTLATPATSTRIAVPTSALRRSPVRPRQ